jgi:hypothetical protein
VFHYFTAIQNTQGDALVGYFVKAVSTTSGSVVDIYADQSATVIEAVSGVTNAAEVDSDGNASFYIPGGTYDLDIYATDGVTFVKRISDVQMVDFATLSTTGIGYAVGAGGTVTQLTSKSTGVTLDALSGQITTNAASLAASTTVGFTLTNALIASTDVLVVNIASGATANSYQTGIDAVATGSANIRLRNNSGGALAQALVLNFVVIKGVTA